MPSMINLPAYLHLCESAEALGSGVACYRLQATGYPKLRSLLTTTIYSKTPIYRASRGIGEKPGKSGDTVNRGMKKIDQNSAYLRFKIFKYVMHLRTLVDGFFEFL